ncbi:hypothetical protein GQ53DRAFT_740668 [Thozetella sp. PMI_491]|nr:hypothetical protein GQ53DRAFT_740668 [Thozetella sp. PMI_491]
MLKCNAFGVQRRRFARRPGRPRRPRSKPTWEGMSAMQSSEDQGMTMEVDILQHSAQGVSRMPQCDLGLPRCITCAQRSIPCSYEPQVLANRAGRATSPTTNTAVSERTSPASKSPPKLAIAPISIPTQVDWPLYRGQSLEPANRLLEQQLCHFYIQRIEEPDIGNFWLPKDLYTLPLSVGFENPYLINGIMALGATGVAVSGGGTPRLQTVVHHYTSRLIEGQLAAIESSGSSTNFDLIFISANLIASQTLMARQLLPPVRSSLRGIVDWLRVWRGVKSLVLSSPAHLVSESRFKPLLAATAAQAQTYTAHSPFKDDVLAFLLQGLPRMSTPRRIYAAYQETVDILCHLYRYPTRMNYGRFFLDTPSAFVKCVERCEPTALAIMGVFLAISRIMDMPFISDAIAEIDLRLILDHLPSIHRRLVQRAIDLIGDGESRKAPQIAIEIDSQANV